MRDGGPLFTPALARQLAKCCSSYTETAVQLTHGGDSAVAAAEARIQRVLPPGFPLEFYVTSGTESKAQRAIEPTSIALAVFGGIAGLAALVIAGQVIGRQLRLGAGDLAVLRALGSRPAGIVCDGLPGVVCAVAAGALLADVVAAGLSPIAPLGPVRAVYPFRGVAFDWTVLGAGAGVFTVALSLLAVGVARRQAPHRVAGSPRPGPGSGSFWVRVARTRGLPASAGEGIRLALDPGGGRRPVPLRSVIGGTVLAIVALLATVTFGASLQTLVSHPALYGWNWTFALNAGSPSYVATDRAGDLLDHDPAVAGWTGIYFATARIDGQTVPVIGMSPHSTVAPALLSGHGLETTGQVVLGAATLDRLHKRVGDAVTVEDGGPRPYRLRIAGTATLPSLGPSGTLHTEMGTGAVFSYQLIPGAVSGQPNEILVSLRPGADPGAARARLQRLVPAVNGGTVSGVQRPAEIVGYRTMGTAPVLLATALAAGAISSLWLALMASVRHRRKDLALLKTLGFTRRQLGATVAWQATVTVLAGTVAGVPLGVGLGRFLWDLFARQIDVVPEPIVPVPAVAAVIAGALLTANVVAALPGRAAGRTPAAALLRSE
jgi:putative ABC transport system permease protein